MLINTKEVVKFGNKTYAVFHDTENDRDEFIETEDAENEFDFY